jgi:hypothetical protein
MHDVGLCSVSKCVNIAQSLLDILVYNQEKLGSRPTRNLMVASGGLDADDIKHAFALANEAMDNAALSRFSKSVVIGDASAPEGKLEMHDLASLPDGFSYETSMSLGMAAIALAFGVDARELWPMMGTGATRADALIQHIKAQTKGIGHLLQIAESAIFSKILPTSLEAFFDYTDDAQDRQAAEIKMVRSERHKVDLVDSEVLDTRTVREQMLWDDDITQAQFEALELDEGRLDDGTPVLQVFYDPEYRSMLRMGIPDPLDMGANTKDLILPILDEKEKDLIKRLGKDKNPKERRQLMTALAAVKALRERYDEEKEPVPPALAAAAGKPVLDPTTGLPVDETTPNLALEGITDGDLAPVSPDEV